MKKRSAAKRIFRAGIKAVLPDKLIREHLSLCDDRICVSGRDYLLDDIGNLYIIAIGKAAALMARETEIILADRITTGIVLTKYGYGCPLRKLILFEAGHPLPDNNGIFATQRILELAHSAGEKDLVICLISGGASSLMADYPDGATLDDLVVTNRLLVESGAGIDEINTVRKHLSSVKGGRLTQAIYPASTESLILSDVIGDSPSVIASGPTSADPTTFQMAIDVLDKYLLMDKIPSIMLRHLKKGMKGEISETPVPGDIIFSKAKNSVIGNNALALSAACNEAIDLGYESHVVTNTLKGDYTGAANFILEKTGPFINDRKKKNSVCLLFGGEPTVHVCGNGKGGRNQQLALYLSSKLDAGCKTTILCGGTDGTDGPTNAAGAVIDETTFSNAISRNTKPASYLQNFDAYSFFRKAGGLVITGSTMTNVMDMIIVIV